MRNLQTIYELLSEYTKEEIDSVIEGLTEKEKELLKLRYGDDLNNPVKSNNWNQKYNQQFYVTLLAKIRRGLKKLRRQEIIEDTTEEMPIQVDKKLTTGMSFVSEQEEAKRTAEFLPLDYQQADTNVLTITKNLLKALQIPDYQYLFTKYTPQEIIVALLTMQTAGNYTIQEIVQFMKLSESEVISITKRVLVSYRESINTFFDNMLQDLDTKEQEIIGNKKAY